MDTLVSAAAAPQPAAPPAVTIMPAPAAPVAADAAPVLSPVAHAHAVSPVAERVLSPLAAVTPPAAAAAFSPVAAALSPAASVLSPVAAALSPVASELVFTTPPRAGAPQPATPTTVRETSGGELSFGDMDDVTVAPHLLAPPPLAEAPALSPSVLATPLVDPAEAAPASPAPTGDAWLTPTEEPATTPLVHSAKSMEHVHDAPATPLQRPPAPKGAGLFDVPAVAAISSPIGADEDPTDFLSPARTNADLDSSFQSPSQLERAADPTAAAPSSLLWGEGLLSPIREETDDYTSDMSSSTTIEARLSVVPPVMPASPLALPMAATVPVPPRAEQQATTPVKEPAVALVMSPLLMTPPDALRTVATAPALSPSPQPVLFNPVTPLVTSPATHAVGMAVTSASVGVGGAASVLPTTPLGAQVSATANAAATPPSALQAELARIKQRIRVWDVTSPVKQPLAPPDAPTTLMTPHKVPKYSELEVAAVRAEADAKAQAENERLRAEFAALKESYEKEKRVSTQLREIVDEFESTIRVMVEGHAKQMEAERASAAQLVSQNTELLALVEDRQRKCDALERERVAVTHDLEEAHKAQAAAQHSLDAANNQLQDTTNKYQALKQQAEKKLALANERLQQQQTVNAE